MNFHDLTNGYRSVVRWTVRELGGKTICAERAYRGVFARPENREGVLTGRACGGEMADLVESRPIPILRERAP